MMSNNENEVLNKGSACGGELVRNVSIIAHKRTRYYRYLGVDGRYHEVEEGKRVEVLPIGYGYPG